MMMTRRRKLFLLVSALGGSFGASSLSACTTRGTAFSKTVDDIPGLDPLGGYGIIAVRNGKRVLERVGGFAGGLDASENAPKRPFTANSPFRVASISKVTALLTAHALHDTGQLDLDDDIGRAIGLPLRHPDHPDVPVTLRKVLSHRSGISDPEVYWTEPSGDIRELLSPDMFKGGKPGESFEYANINYGIAATVMEVETGERFDVLTKRYVLAPLGLDAGFNWAGVSQAKRRKGATLYREVDGAMTIQTDGPKTLNDSGPVLYGDDPDFTLSGYKPGTNGTLLSPQGGLRASLEDLLVIAESLANHPELHQADWIYDGHNGAADNGHFVSFGPGLYVYPPDLSPIPGQLMVGHHGEAYGMYGGMWHLPQIDAQIVHAVTATPQPPRPQHVGPPAIAAESRILLNRAMPALGLN